ncbi:Uncharacterised protein [uncultured archaeon]|nr:Uncharacterised protein [uncultured archaeon]
MTREIVNLHVLAIARPEKKVVCVAGINDKGEWIRPQRIFENDIAAGKFKLFGITNIHVDSWIGKTIRCEDRFLIREIGKLPNLIGEIPKSEIQQFLEMHLDKSVDSVFMNERTLGLIKPQQIIKITGDTTKIWISFRDSTRKQFNCSVRDDLFYHIISTYKEKYSTNFRERIHHDLNKNDTYFVIGLTQIYENNINVEYGGWPMIVGIHSLERK